MQIVRRVVAQIAANILSGLTGVSNLVEPQGRLTLTTAVPVLTATVSAAATVYYTPYVGNAIPIYDGSTWKVYNFAELSNVLANAATGNAGPAAAVASKNYDLFVWDNAGTRTLTRGAAWNSDTARSATTENDLQRVNGVLTNLNAITNGPGVGLGTYVGTVRTDAGGATVTYDLGSSASGGGLASFGLWNAYNQVEQTTTVVDSGVNYTYSSATLRAARGSNTYRANLIAGLNVNNVQASSFALISTAATSGAFTRTYIGLDTITAQTGQVIGQVYTNAAVVLSAAVAASYKGLPGLGFHYLSGNESGDGSNTNTVNTGTLGSTLNVTWKW